MTDTDDLVAIQQLIARYAVVVDAQQWDDLDELFTGDARIDYTALGAPAGSLADIKSFMQQMLPGFTRTQHLMGLPSITVTGDRATARTSCTNPMVPPGRGGDQVWLFGLWYDDELVRTADRERNRGWKIATRTQTRCFTLTGFTDSPIS